MLFWWIVCIYTRIIVPFQVDSVVFVFVYRFTIIFCCRFLSIYSSYDVGIARFSPHYHGLQQFFALLSIYLLHGQTTTKYVVRMYNRWCMQRLRYTNSQFLWKYRVSFYPLLHSHLVLAKKSSKFRLLSENTCKFDNDKRSGKTWMPIDVRVDV